VTRDKLMSKLHLSYPDYAFDKHKWYGTKFHRDKIIEIWPSKIHRISYLKNILNPEKNLKTKKTRKWT
jgi:ribonuclease HII